MSPHAGEMLVNEIAPRIRSLTKTAPKIGADDHEEINQDALAVAASLLSSIEERGKKAVSAGNIAFFAIRLVVKGGRRSTGSSKTDVLSPGTQMSRRSHVRSLDEPIGWDDCTEEPLTLGEVLASEAEDPSVTGARNLDWQAFTDTLDELSGAILECMAKEIPLTEVALAFGKSRSTIQTYRDKLTEAVRLFMGDQVLAQIQMAPAWRNNIVAARERAACRVERQMA